MPRRPPPQPEPAAGYFTRPKTHIAWFSTGCKTLDMALGGGWAAPYIINLVGDRSSGKTLLAIESAIEFLRRFRHGRVTYKRAERTFDLRYAQALGLDLARCDLGAESIITVEDIHDEIERLAVRPKKGEPVPKLYIIDSWDAVKHRAELKRDFGSADYGRKALLLSEFLRRLEAPMVDARITLLIISQIRENIGAIFNSKRRAGGEALNFYASQIVWLLPKGAIQREVTLRRGRGPIKRTIGSHIIAKVEKNKHGLPGRAAFFDVLLGYGIDDVGSCLGFLDRHGGAGAALNGMKPLAAAKLIRGHGEGWEAVQTALHAEVERQWWQLESVFTPAITKYGAQ